MKIESSNLLLSGSHSAVEQHKVHESLRMWVGERRPDFERGETPPPAQRADKVTLSEAAVQAAAKPEAAEAEDAAENDPQMQLLIAAVEMLTGKKIKVVKLKDIAPDTPPPEIKDPKAAQAQPQPPAAGYGIEYDYHESHYEAEQTTFAAEGVVRTADGQEIRFSLRLEMRREFSQEVDVNVRLGDAARQKKDPLVLNFNGTAAQLTERKFSFDLDADGTAEQVSFVGAGSGFLALDRNQDGKINDGGELFGPLSGDGFSELADHDADRNGWIDENDPIYAELRIWTKDVKGNDVLAGLKEKGVGAISLARIATEFSLKNPQNDLLGQIRSSGVYLNEDGSAGSVQQIDLAV
ncbi:MAG: VCBS repeat-containing protein [Pseudomonadota bacterium]|jgi:hypothetical protein